MTSSRRLLSVGLGALGALLSSLVAGALLAPASADVPVGWGESAPPSVGLLHALLLLGGVPVLLAVILVAMVYVPSMLRGEQVSPTTAPVADQWLGGPRKGTRELAGPDSEESAAGGARGSW